MCFHTNFSLQQPSTRHSNAGGQPWHSMGGRACPFGLHSWRPWICRLLLIRGFCAGASPSGRDCAVTCEIESVHRCWSIAALRKARWLLCSSASNYRYDHGHQGLLPQHTQACNPCLWTSFVNCFYMFGRHYSSCQNAAECGCLMECGEFPMSSVCLTTAVHCPKLVSPEAAGLPCYHESSGSKPAAARTQEDAEDDFLMAPS